MKPLDLPEIPLPKSWDENIKRGLLAAFTLAHYTLVSVRAWGHSTAQLAVRREVEHERRETDAALLREQVRLLQERMRKVHARPHYDRFQRFAVLSVQQARGWSNARTASEFLVSPITIAQWHRRLGNDSLLEAPGLPVNRYPDFVVSLVQQLKMLFPLLGARQIADWLARAGLHLSATSVRRYLKKPIPLPPRPKKIPFLPKRSEETKNTARATAVGNIWHVDITVVPSSWGLAISWWPGAFPPIFPFSWMVIAVMDSFSRKVLALRVVRQEAKTKHVVEALDGAVRDAGAPPRHLITDKGTQFFNSRKGGPTAGLQAWLDRYRVKPRFGAVGKKGSIALIERFFRTLKQQGIREMLVPYDIEWMNAELAVFSEWYNTRRPHSALDGATPNEIHSGIDPPRAQPRYEVRSGYPIGREDIESGKVWRVERVALDAGCFKRRKHLPDISLDVAA